MSRGSTTRYFELESRFAHVLMEWISQHGIKLENTVCTSWEPARARTTNLDFWEQSEQQLKKWKIIDNIATPMKWETKSTVARNCRAQNLTDHRPVVTYVSVPQKKAEW